MNLDSVTRDDFSQWKAMRHVLYGQPMDEEHDEELEQKFASPVWHCWLVRGETGAVIGFVELSERNIVDDCLTSPVAYLEGLYLKPEFRGQGNGSRLMDLLVAWCAGHGFREMATDALITNKAARRFYLREGFEESYRVVQFRRFINE